MRGVAERQATMLIGITPDALIPTDHPIRRIKAFTDQALVALRPTFAAMYAERGRPSVPPERLLKGSLLIALSSIRSERQFCERLRYDLLFKWFLDLNIGDAGFDATSFTKNRERLLTHDVAGQFFRAVVEHARSHRLLSADHFTVDGTLLEAWASLKSVRPRQDAGAPPAPLTGQGKNPSVDWKGQTRSNATHVSTTDPEARLATKGAGQTVKLCFLGELLTENRNGLVVDVALSAVTGRAEWEQALGLLGGLPDEGRATVGGDKHYDTTEFVTACRALQITPHVAQKAKGSAIDGRTTRHPGYATSQRRRKRIEEVFGWMKTVGGGRKLRYVGVVKNRLWFTVTAAAYNLVRLVTLVPATG
jgi:transposase